MSKDDGGPAFPTDSEHQCGNSVWHSEGMTLRDHFAAAALQGFCANPSSPADLADDIEHICYQMADLMIKERTK